ncbi:OLC1v1022683C1 [Oldenlandia corymbosa var. corymbosa]|uniref:OLC1v1022683C1 n=1 Tax=Oldenlandia corymbosa var. corymbosa TaxID=529605 RepID=A0AAV1C106_OLDCO|nr:OLC1v1022683C1 [Oldenlandia corymbosa var. corymbosa]
MNSFENHGVPGFSYTVVDSPRQPVTQDTNDPVPDLAAALRAVEKVLQYKFGRVELLEEALTHSSYTDSACYERLEFIGDSALGLAVSNYVFLTYPNLDQGQLSLLRAANISTEKLARAAVKHGLHRYIRHNAAPLHEKVRDFALAVEEEGETEVYGGEIRAPKILADIVESVAAAVYVDCGFDLKASWPIFERLLEPLVTLDVLQRQPQPVTMLFELCQKERKQVNITYSKEGGYNFAYVFVDGELIGSASAKQKENAKLHAAKDALQKLSYNNGCKVINVDYYSELNDSSEIDGAKHKLHEICGKKKWPKPIYRTEEEKGPAHDKRYICSVRVETATTQLSAKGEERSRIRDAENSAATTIILGLQQSNKVRDKAQRAIFVDVRCPVEGCEENWQPKILRNFLDDEVRKIWEINHEFWNSEDAQVAGSGESSDLDKKFDAKNPTGHQDGN